MRSLLNSEIRQLKTVAKHPVIAAWDHRRLCMLWNAGLVEKAPAYLAEGRLSRNSIWTITERGQAALEQAERSR